MYWERKTTRRMEEGALFGKYEMGRLLGCGAFAKVYYARNVRNGQGVAIKVINKNKITGTSLMNNIKREVRIMSRLRHPNIVQLYEVMASKSKIYFAMEYVKGGELFAKVAKGRFSEDLARNYFRQLVSAVGYCHSQGIYHRDLKPENLLVDENGQLKVSDFGLSAMVNDANIPTSGLLHTLCGTPAYVAPEILAKKGYEGSKVDVWSCGVILYVLTAGYLPFHHPNLMAMYRKIYRGEYKCPKWMSSDLKRFLSLLLHTDPNIRVTVDGILRDPWFTEGGTFAVLDNICHHHQNVNYHDDKEECLQQERLMNSSTSATSSSSSSSSSPSLSPLNAFHLISYSSGLDLSGLFRESLNPMTDVNAERFLSAEPVDKIIERIGEAIKGEAENVRTRVILKWNKEYYGGVELEEPNGNVFAKVDIRPLTKQLVVVEVKKKGCDHSASYQHDEIWKNKVRPQLCSLVYDGANECHDPQSYTNTRASPIV